MRRSGAVSKGAGGILATMSPAPVPIVAPASARVPGPWEGRGGGPYVDRDEAGTPPARIPGATPGRYQPPVGVPLTERAARGGSWTFAALGDYGAGGAAQAQVAASLLQRAPDLLLTLGDNVYDFGLELEYRRRWDPPHLFGDVRSSVPVFPSLGNHDVRVRTNAYFRRFPELGRARYYSFERDGVSFTALDTNQSLAPGSTQHAWLAEQLRAASDANFRVLFAHHPLRSSQPRSDDRLLSDLAPLLQANRVDLVLGGHEHQYERTKTLNAYGTIAVTHGGGGKAIHAFATPQAPWSASRRADYGFLEFEVTADALVGFNVLADGSVADTFTVPRGGATGARAGADDLGAAYARPRSA